MHLSEGLWYNIGERLGTSRLSTWLESHYTWRQASRQLTIFYIPLTWQNQLHVRCTVQLSQFCYSYEWVVNSVIQLFVAFCSLTWSALWWLKEGNHCCIQPWFYFVSDSLRNNYQLCPWWRSMHNRGAFKNLPVFQDSSFCHNIWGYWIDFKRFLNGYC